MKDGERMIYFVRHGQSEDNLAPVFQAPDSPLTEHGREQARLIAGRVSRLPFDALIASPWPRTKATAEAIAEATGKTPEYSELLVERVKPARLNGRRYDDPEANELWKAWDIAGYTPGMRVEDGENYDDLVARADRAFSLLESRPESSIVVVTHGLFLRILLARILFRETLTGELLRQFILHSMTTNTGLSVIKYSSMYEGPAWRLVTFNDQAHLG